MHFDHPILILVVVVIFGYGHVNRFIKVYRSFCVQVKQCNFSVFMFCSCCELNAANMQVENLFDLKYAMKTAHIDGWSRRNAQDIWLSVIALFKKTRKWMKKLRMKRRIRNGKKKTIGSDKQLTLKWLREWTER